MANIIEEAFNKISKFKIEKAANAVEQAFIEQSKKGIRNPLVKIKITKAERRLEYLLRKANVNLLQEIIIGDNSHRVAVAYAKCSLAEKSCKNYTQMMHDANVAKGDVINAISKEVQESKLLLNSTEQLVESKTKKQKM